MKPQFHENFYSYAKYYDIAFDFKDIPAECTFIEDVYKTHSKPQGLHSFIEFGAGPALHCLEMAKTKKLVTAVDLSPQMTTYATEKAQAQGLAVNCECADMVTYTSSHKYDAAALLMDSTSYLLTNQDVITHLQHVAKVLNPEGIYILEMSHPKSVFDVAKTALNEWDMEKENIKIKIRWGVPEDTFDPITQITNVSVRLEVEDRGETQVLQDQSPQRCFTATEIAALVEASQVFELASFFGAMNTQVPFDNAEKSWRMVVVLKKKN